MSVSDQGEAANTETKELQPIKPDCLRGQRGDKAGFSPAAPYRPPEGTGDEGEGSPEATEGAATQPETRQECCSQSFVQFLHQHLKKMS